MSQRAVERRSERAGARPGEPARRGARRRAGLVALALAAAGLVITAPRAACAEVAVDCDFLEFTGKAGDKPAIDGELKPLEKKLKKAPFATWNQFTLLAHAHKSLSKKKPEPVNLKIGAATATLVEIVDNSKVRLTVAMTDAKGKEVANNTATIAAGDYVIYVHPLAHNEGHLLSVSCK